jgi:hypothetical protein
MPIREHIHLPNLGYIINHPDSEYNSRLLQSLIIYSTNNKSTQSCNSDFHHYKRGIGYDIYGLLFEDELPGRLEKVSQNNDYVLNFFDPREYSNENIKFENENYYFTIGNTENNILIDLFKNHGISYTQEESKLTIDSGNWENFIGALDYKDLEKTLTEAINQDEKKKIVDVTILQNGEVTLTADKKQKIIHGLTKLRDDIFLNKIFFNVFTDDHAVLKTQQYFRSLANTANIYINVLSNNSVNISSSKWDIEFKLFGEEINKTLLIYDGLAQEENFSYKEALGHDESSKINFRKIHSYLKKLPFSSLIISPINRIYTWHKNPENNQNIFSAEIREQLSLTIPDEWHKFTYKDVRRFHHKHRISKDLVGRKEKIKFYYYNLSFFCKILAIIFITCIITLEIIGKICNKLGLFQNKHNTHFFFLKVTAIFNFLLVLFVIDTVVGEVFNKVFSCLIVIGKCIDQYLFGKIFTNLFNLILLGLNNIIKNIHSFFKDLFHNVAEHGFFQGIKETYNKTEITETIKNAPKNAFDFYDNFLKKCEQSESIYLPSKWTFNILNPFGTAVKIYKIAKHDKGFGYTAFFLHCLDFLNNQTGKQTIEHSKLVKLHKTFIQKYLSKEDWNILNIKFTKLCNNYPEILGILSKSDITKNIFKNSVFSIEEYYKAVVIKYIKSERNQDVVKKEVDKEQIQNRLDLIRYALNKIEKENIFGVVNKYERAFKSTTTHYRILNELRVYEKILSSKDTEILECDLIQLDKVFKKQLSNAYHLIKKVDHIKHQPNDEKLQNFHKNLSFKHIDLQEHSEDIDKIADYIRLDEGYYSPLEWILGKGNDFIEDISDIRTIPHIFLFGMFSKLKWNVSIIDFNIWEVLNIEARDILTKDELTQILFNLTEYTSCTKEQFEYCETIKEIISQGEYVFISKKSDGKSYLYVGKKSKKSHECILTDTINKIVWFICELFFINQLIEYFNQKQEKAPPVPPFMSSEIKEIIVENVTNQNKVICEC